MVRRNSPVDLGLWADFIDSRTLIMPLDTHVLQQSVRLGLLSGKTATMSTAKKLTDKLSEFFPDDPLKGDFALFGYGVNSAMANRTHAMLLEGRKNGYTLGGRQFIERFKVGLFVPMHFTTGFEPSEQREQSRTCSNYAESRERKSGAQSSWRMKEFTDEKNILFWEISREGETIEI